MVWPTLGSRMAKEQNRLWLIKYLSTCPSVRPSIHPSIHLSVYLTTYYYQVTSLPRVCRLTPSADTRISAVLPGPGVTDGMATVIEAILTFNLTFVGLVVADPRKRSLLASAVTGFSIGTGAMAAVRCRSTCTDSSVATVGRGHEGAFPQPGL